jgi:FkbM family methyltransferase
VDKKTIGEAINKGARRLKEVIAEAALGYRRLMMLLMLSLGKYTAIANTSIGPIVVNLRDRGVGQPIFLNRSWEINDTRYLEGNLFPDSIFIDIGANIGYYTILSSRLVGAHGTVFSFEPNQHNFQMLAKSVALNRCENVTAHQLALGETDKRQWLYKSSSNYGDHRFAIHEFEKNREKEMVSIMRLDSFLNALPAEKKIAIKMDVQGLETQVIRGMKRLLDERDVYLVMAEYCPRLISLSGDDPGDMLELLRNAGFQSFLLDADGDAKQVAYHEIPNQMPYWESVTGPFLNVIFRRG